MPSVKVAYLVQILDRRRTWFVRQIQSVLIFVQLLWENALKINTRTCREVFKFWNPKQYNPI